MLELRAQLLVKLKRPTCEDTHEVFRFYRYKVRYKIWWGCDKHMFCMVPLRHTTIST